jgi:hypothetical protein
VFEGSGLVAVRERRKEKGEGEGKGREKGDGKGERRERYHGGNIGKVGIFNDHKNLINFGQVSVLLF